MHAWTREQFDCLVSTFPEGQVAVIYRGRLVATAVTDSEGAAFCEASKPEPLDTVPMDLSVQELVDFGLHHPEELVPRTPVTLAQIQLNAYNSRDLKTFLSVFHPSRPRHS